LEIFGDFEIPEGSKFGIGSSGLLGDALIEITPPPERNGNFVAAGSTIIGARGAGLSALASAAENLSIKGQLVLDDVHSAMGNIRSAVKKIDNKVLNEDNLKKFDTAMAELATATEALNSKLFTEGNSASVSEMLTNLKQASAKVDVAAAKIGPLLGRGDEVIAALEPSLDRIAKAAIEIEAAVEKASTGSGLLATLLNDSKLKEDLQGFAANLRRSGILRYRDRGVDPDAEDTAPPKKRKGLFRGR